MTAWKSTTLSVEKRACLLAKEITRGSLTRQEVLEAPVEVLAKTYEQLEKLGVFD